MALESKEITLPRSVATAITETASDTSTIMALSPNKPEIFADETYLVFSGDAEADVVAEGDASNGYDQDAPAPIVAKRLVLQTTTRVSSQLQWADEDNKLEIISAIQEDQAKAIGRALDYIVYHAASPKTGLALTGYDALSSKAQKVYLGADLASATEKQLIDALDNMAELVSDLHDVSGVALSKIYAAALRRIRVKNSMARMFPEIPINLQPGTIDGVPAATSGTVNGRRLKTPSNVLSFMGDFSAIKWGLVRDMTAEIIPFGDPDGSGKDLKRYNQIAYRTTGVYGYAVLDPNAFSVLMDGKEPTSTTTPSGGGTGNQGSEG